MKNRFYAIGEYYASGMFEDADAPLFQRYSRGLRRYLEHLPLPAYRGEPLYPCGTIPSGMCVRHSYSFTVDVDWNQLAQKDAVAFLCKLVLDCIFYKVVYPIAKCCFGLHPVFFLISPKKIGCYIYYNIVGFFCKWDFYSFFKNIFIFLR